MPETVLDLGNRVMAKYPAYQGMDPADVGRRVKAKYPDAYGHFEDVQSEPQDPTKTPEYLLQNLRLGRIRGETGGPIPKQPTLDEAKAQKQAEADNEAEIDRIAISGAIGKDLPFRLGGPTEDEVAAYKKTAAYWQARMQIMEDQRRGQEAKQRALRGAEAGMASIPLYENVKGAIAGAFSDEGAGKGFMRGFKETAAKQAALMPADTEAGAAARQYERQPKPPSLAETITKATGSPTLGFVIGDILADPITLAEMGAGGIAALERNAVRRAVAKGEIAAENAAKAQRVLDEIVKKHRGPGLEGAAEAERLANAPVTGPGGKPLPRPEIQRPAERFTPEEEFARMTPEQQEAVRYEQAQAQATRPTREIPRPAERFTPEEEFARLSQEEQASARYRAGEKTAATGPSGEPLPRPEFKPQETYVPELTPEQQSIEASRRGVTVEELPSQLAHERLISGLGSSLGNVNWSVLGADMVSAGRRALSMGHDTLEKMGAWLVETYGEKIRPYVGRIWEQVKTGHPVRAVGEALEPVADRMPLSQRTIERRIGPDAAHSVRMADAEATQFRADQLEPIANDVAAVAKDADTLDFIANKGKQALEGEIPESAIPERAKPILDKLKALYEAGHAKIKEVFPDVGKISQYGGPDIMTDEAVSQVRARKGPIWDHLVDWAQTLDEKYLRQGAVSEAVEGISKRTLSERFVQAMAEGDVTIRSGFLKGRKLNLPTITADGTKILETDALKLYKRWVDSMAKSYGTEMHLGGEKLGAAEEAAFQHGGQRGRELLGEQVARLQGTPHLDASARFLRGDSVPAKIIRGAGNLGRAGMLSVSSLGQTVEGGVPTASMGGVKTAGEALYKLIKGGETAEAIEARRAFSSTLGDAQHAYEQALGKGDISKKGMDQVLRRTGFNEVNRVLTQHALTAANLSLEKVIGGGNLKAAVEFLGEFGFREPEVRRMMESGITRLDRFRIMREWAYKANGVGGATFSRRLLSHPVAQEMMVFTAPVRFVGDTAISAVRQLKNGNVAPLATFLIGGTLAADAKKAIYDAFSTRKAKVGEKTAMDELAAWVAETNVAGMLGRGFYAMKRGAKEGKPIAGTATQFLVPPYFTFWDKVFQNVRKYGPVTGVAQSVKLTQPLVEDDVAEMDVERMRASRQRAKETRRRRLAAAAGD